MSRSTEIAIASLAAGQYGVVARAQLLTAGLTDAKIGHRVRTGRLRPIHRGVYLVGVLEGAYSREMAAVLACGEGAVISHLSAAALWGLVRPRTQAAPLHVTVPHGRRPRRDGVIVHRAMEMKADEVTEWRGIPITVPVRTLADVASGLGERGTEQAFAKGCRHGVIDRSDLSAFVSRWEGRPGVPILRALASSDAEPAFTRSEAEERFLALVRRAGLIGPEVNVVVEGHEVDFYWPNEGLIVEIDGYAFHSSGQQFECDRLRDGELTAAGCRVVRVTWRQIVEQPMATMIRVAQALGRGRPTRKASSSRRRRA